MLEIKLKCFKVILWEFNLVLGLFSEEIDIHVQGHR